VDCSLRSTEHLVAISVRYRHQTIRSETAATLQSARDTAARWRSVMLRKGAFTEVIGPLTDVNPTVSSGTARGNVGADGTCNDGAAGEA
jgi:hypothetical protein